MGPLEVSHDFAENDFIEVKGSEGHKGVTSEK